MKNLNIDYEIENFCEIDKYAAKSYCRLNNIDKRFNLGDITEVDIPKLNKNIDLLVHGSPCQSFSIRGKQLGGDEGSGTRSSLMWKTIDIVRIVKPKIIVWENVKNILSEKHVHNFNKYITVLSELGYNSYFEVLNARDFNIPQNRERLFVVSILKVKDNGKFVMPKSNSETCKVNIRDMLEKNVNEKYYLDKERTNAILDYLKNGTITNNKISYIEKKYITFINNYGYIPEFFNPYNGRELVTYIPTLTTTCGTMTSSSSVLIKEIKNHTVRFRRITPKEAMRFMGYTESDYNLIKDINSDSQLYKQLGNSIVVNVLIAIFESLVTSNIINY